MDPDTICTDSVELIQAISAGDIRRVRDLLTSGLGANVNDGSGRTALGVASMLGSAEVVELLLKHGADPDAPDSLKQTPLMWAVRYDHSPTVTLLLRAGADPHRVDSTGHSVSWHANHRELHFRVPMVRGLHGSLIARRLRQTRSKRLIADASSVALANTR